MSIRTNLIQQVDFQILLEGFPDLIFDIFSFSRWNLKKQFVPYKLIWLAFDEMHKLSETWLLQFSPPGILDENLGKILVKNFKSF